MKITSKHVGMRTFDVRYGDHQRYTVLAADAETACRKTVKAMAIGRYRTSDVHHIYDDENNVVECTMRVRARRIGVNFQIEATEFTPIN